MPGARSTRIRISHWHRPAECADRCWRCPACWRRGRRLLALVENEAHLRTILLDLAVRRVVHLPDQLRAGRDPLRHAGGKDLRHVARSRRRRSNSDRGRHPGPRRGFFGSRKNTIMWWTTATVAGPGLGRLDPDVFLEIGRRHEVLVRHNARLPGPSVPRASRKSRPACRSPSRRQIRRLRADLSCRPGRSRHRSRPRVFALIVAEPAVVGKLL